MGIVDELLELEHAGWRSLCEGSGGAFYGSVMAEDAVMVLAHGFVFDRAETLDSLDGTPPWSGYEITDERLVAVGVDAAALVYRARAWRDGEPAVFRALMSSVYVRTPEGWRLSLYQQTPVPRDG
jgi:hypothetical protein